jgi:hypothetical protein
VRNTPRTQNSGRVKDIDLTVPDLKLAFIFIGTGNVSCSLLYFSNTKGVRFGLDKASTQPAKHSHRLFGRQCQPYPLLYLALTLLLCSNRKIVHQFDCIILSLNGLLWMERR